MEVSVFVGFFLGVLETIEAYDLIDVLLGVCKLRVVVVCFLSGVLAFALLCVPVDVVSCIWLW